MLKWLIGSSLVLAGLVWWLSGNGVVAGIVLLASLAIDIVVFKDYI